MVDRIIMAVVCLYIGAGLSLGLVMAQVLPLTPIGVGVYAATWPHSVYCARPGTNCFAMKDVFPDWLVHMMFDLEKSL